MHYQNYQFGSTINSISITTVSYNNVIQFLIKGSLPVEIEIAFFAGGSAVSAADGWAPSIACGSVTSWAVAGAFAEGGGADSFLFFLARVDFIFFRQ